MRHSFIPILVLAITLFSIPASAQSDDLAAIKKVFDLGEKYWNAGDIDGYVNLYTPDDSCRMILSRSIVYGRKGILDFYKKYWPKERMGNLVTDNYTYERLSDDYYFVTGLFHVSYPDGKKVEGRFSLLMKKIDGQWYYYTDHSG